MPCPIVGQGARGRTESGEMRQKDAKRGKIFLAATMSLLPFYLLPCSQSPRPHLILFPLLSVPWERTEKTRRPVCLLYISFKSVTAGSPREHFNLFALTTLLSLLYSSLSQDAQGPLKN